MAGCSSPCIGAGTGVLLGFCDCQYGVIARRAQHAEAISRGRMRLLRGVYPWARRRRDPGARNDARGQCMPTYPRDRFAYSSPFTRKPLRLAKGRMIVWSVVNIEEWEITRPMARALSQPP